MKAGSHTYDYPRPTVTVDGVILTIQDGWLVALVIKRAHKPFANCWAFPGGFVDPEEPLEHAMRRELAEETGIEVRDLRTFGAFGDPGRDPRGWCITVSYYALIAPVAALPRAGDDAADVAWIPVVDPPTLAFDHRLMLDACLRQLRQDIYVTSVARSIMGDESFTREQLIRVYGILDPHCPPEKLLLRRLGDAGVIERVSTARYRFTVGGAI